MPVFLTHAIARWAEIYNGSAPLRTFVAFVHVAGLVGGGGAAVVADRATLIATRRGSMLGRAQLEAIHNTHRVVVLGLAAVIVSGILLFSYRRTVLLFEQAIENRIKSERLSFEADHDPLTKLPNRRGLNTHLRKIHSLSRRMEDLYAVFYMDLDGFKLVNDRLGHEAGDAVLVTTTSLFTQVLRDTDFLARAGGDEFVLVIHRYRDDNELELLAQRIINSLKQPIMVNQKYCHIGVSIGIARYPADAKHLDSILQIADSLMYQSKEAGKNRYTFA